MPAAYRGRTGLVTVKVSNSSRVYGTLQNGYTYAKSLAPLLANAGADVYDYANKPISISGSASGGVPSYSFYWKFADNTTSQGATATHTYPVSGNYPVILTVTDNSGATASDTAVDFIFPQPTQTPTPTPSPKATPGPTPTKTPTATPTTTPIPLPVANAGVDKTVNEGSSCILHWLSKRRCDTAHLCMELW